MRCDGKSGWSWLVLLALFLAPGLAAAQTNPPTHPTGESPSRGPLEIRDEHLLAQGRLTLPAVSARTLPPGSWSLDLSLLGSNSFSWTQDVPGEDPAERLFLVDGEAWTLTAQARRGVGRDLDVAVRVPLRHRDGGVLDGLIDAWHRLLNVEDGARPSFLKDAFRVEGLTTAEQPFDWTGAEGTGLGDLEISARWRVLDGAAAEPSVALVGRVSLPTATGTYSNAGLGFGAQVVLNAPLGRKTDLYAGAGFTIQDPGPVRGVEYARTRAHGFAAFEWRPWRRVSLVVESNAATRLVRNVQSYPGVHWLINGEGRFDLGETVRLNVGLTENLFSQQSTTDLGLYFALGWRP